MKKFLSTLVVAFIIALTFTSCSTTTQEAEIEQNLSMLSKDTTGVANLKTNLQKLNSSYTQSPTRLAKWLRWLIAGVADVGAFLVDGSFSGSVTSSKTVYDMLAKEKKTETETRAISNLDNSADLKDGALIGLDSCSAGYIHNKIIVELYNQYGNALSSMTSEELYKAILTKTYEITGESLSDEEQEQTASNVETIKNLYDENETVETYIEKIKNTTNDIEVKSSLEICGTILYGLQYVDDEDTSYYQKVQKLIEDSDLNTDTKKKINDGASIAFSSAKLWRTEGASVDAISE